MSLIDEHPNVFSWNDARSILMFVLRIFQLIYLPTDWSLTCIFIFPFVYQHFRFVGFGSKGTMTNLIAQECIGLKMN